RSRQKLHAQQLQERPRPARHRRRLDPGRQRHAAVAIRQKDPVSAMTIHIGTPTSRIDGHAKVTGAAKYAGEFGVPGLLYGSVATSTVAKGRIAGIDLAEPLSVG